MGKLEFEVWRLGSIRHQDVCLERYARMADALRALDAHRHHAGNDRFEVRRLGESIDQRDASPRPGRRSSQSRLQAVRESSPAQLRSTHPPDDDVSHSA